MQVLIGFSSHTQGDLQVCAPPQLRCIRKPEHPWGWGHERDALSKTSLLPPPSGNLPAVLGERDWLKGRILRGGPVLLQSKLTGPHPKLVTRNQLPEGGHVT